MVISLGFHPREEGFNSLTGYMTNNTSMTDLAFYRALGQLVFNDAVDPNLRFSKTVTLNDLRHEISRRLEELAESEDLTAS